jgi:hypothetical protein
VEKPDLSLIVMNNHRCGAAAGGLVAADDQILDDREYEHGRSRCESEGVDRYSEKEIRGG